MKRKILNGYQLIYVPDYPSAMTTKNYKGWMYEHRYVMENYLKRQLTKDEVVHHLDGVKDNNHINNLIVLSHRDHNLLHSYQEGKIHQTKKCPQCEKMFKPVNSLSKYCSNLCATRSLRKCKRPSKEELEILIWEHPFTELGKMYGVSDNAVRKWCKKYGIMNFPPKGYFLRRENDKE